MCSKFSPFLKLLNARYHLSCEGTTLLLLGNKYSDEIARRYKITRMCTNKCPYSLDMVKKSTVLLKELDLANVVKLFLLLQYFRYN